jgi:hypothetical protein
MEDDDMGLDVEGRRRGARRGGHRWQGEAVHAFVGSRAYSDTLPSLQRTAQQWFAD